MIILKKKTLDSVVGRDTGVLLDEGRLNESVAVDVDSLPNESSEQIARDHFQRAAVVPHGTAGRRSCVIPMVSTISH